MKKFLALILALVMVFALAACGDAGDTGDGSSSGDTVELILSCNGTEQATTPVPPGALPSCSPSAATAASRSPSTTTTSSPAAT